MLFNLFCCGVILVNCYFLFVCIWINKTFKVFVNSNYLLIFAKLSSIFCKLWNLTDLHMFICTFFIHFGFVMIRGPNCSNKLRYKITKVFFFRNLRVYTFTFHIKSVIVEDLTWHNMIWEWSMWCFLFFSPCILALCLSHGFMCLFHFNQPGWVSVLWSTDRQFRKRIAEVQTGVSQPGGPKCGGLPLKNNCWGEPPNVSGKILIYCSLFVQNLFSTCLRVMIF